MGKEELQEQINRLALAELNVGDRVFLKTGEGRDAFEYEFEIEDTSTIGPSGQLKETRPNGNKVGPLPFTLHGAGQWTTRQQNPVQEQERGFTSYFDSLYLGGFMVGTTPGVEHRLIFDKPGQEISHIEVVKP
jgi:hypothetical protein